MNPTHLKVRDIFSEFHFKVTCFGLWEAHLKWLHDCGFSRAYDQYEGQMLMPVPSGHEVVDLLADFVHTRGFVNAHLGLTSSDIVDNVRLIQLQQSCEVISTSVDELCLKLANTFSNSDMTVGFTHWQPAAPLTWHHRSEAWLSPLRWISNVRPPIFAKKFGGCVGDAASLELVTDRAKRQDPPFEWEHFDLHDPINVHPLQSSDHLCEQQTIGWLNLIGAQLHKIAQDLRFLASHGVVRLGRPAGHAGSSSMPHKTNPYQWEKVCSICRSVSTTAGEMWTVAALNSCERTLDGSWQIKSLLRRACEGIALALDTMYQVDCYIDHAADRRLLASLRSTISSDQDLTRRVLAGESRWSAYQQMLQQINHQESKT